MADIRIEDYIEMFVYAPSRGKIDVLDKFDDALDQFKKTPPKDFREFVEYLPYKAKVLEENEKVEEKKRVDIHFNVFMTKNKKVTGHPGVNVEFIQSIDKRISELSDLLKRISAEQFNITLDIIPQIIADEANKNEVAYMTGIEAEMNAVISKITQLKEQIEATNRFENNALREGVREDNEIYDILEQKKQQLLCYSDVIVNTCSMWGVPINSLDIDNDTFTLDELDSLYSKFLTELSNEQSSGNAVATLRYKFPNVYVQAAIIAGVLFLAYTPILSVLSLAFFITLGLSQIKRKNKVKFYTVLAALIFKVDPKSMNIVELDESLLLPETLTDEMLDEDERFAGFSEELDAIEARGEYEDAVVYQKVLQDFAAHRNEYMAKLNNDAQIFKRKKEVIIQDINDEVAVYVNMRKDALDDYEKFGYRFESSLIFNSEFVFGVVDTINEERLNIGSSTVVIRPSANAGMMQAFLRCMYINAVTHINPNMMKLHIFDPNEQGKMLRPFYDNALDDSIIYYSDNLKKITENLRIQAEANMKLLKGRTIAEHNRRAMEEGISPIGYNILFIISQPKMVEDDEALNTFLKYSGDAGIIVWVVSDIIELPNAKVFRRPFDGIMKPMNFLTDDYCRDFTMRHIKKKKLLEPKSGVLWPDFMKQLSKVRFGGKDPFWTGTGIEFIDFYPGYLNGDPNEIPEFPFGNEGDIHMLGVGGTGAGKSVFINHCIATSTYLYSPSELELWLADFKGVEFQFYLGSEKFPAILPHLKACLCTADPDFATSLFQAFDDMSRLRYSEMKEAGVKNMPGWNNLVKANADNPTPMKKPEKLIELHKDDKNPYNEFWSMEDWWARVLMIVDEFQVIFERADGDNLGLINAAITDISKVARAAGAHIFFTSQSMKKTVSADILNQFSLRFGLRCAMDTSMEIMGSNLSGSITAKNGWLYVKTQSLKPEEARFIKTPFIQDEEDKKYTTLTRETAGITEVDDYVTAANKLHASPLHYHIAHCAQEAINRGMVRKEPPVKYSESDECKIQSLHAIWANKEARKKFDKSGLFFMGDRMAYSTNQAPENFVLGAKNNTHILSVFSQMKDIPNFYRSIIYNIKHNIIEEELINLRGKGQTIIVHTANENLGYLCYAEQDITPGFEKFYDTHTTPAEIIKWATELLEYRKANGVKDSPVWIICLDWNKAKGVGVEADPTLRTKIDTLFNTCGEFNIHFIWILTGIGKIATSTFTVFDTKICGSVDTDTSLAVLGSRIANKTEPKNGWMYIKRDGVTTRIKIYQSKLDREIKSDKVVL